MVEEVFQARSEQVDDQDVVEAFLAEVIDVRNTSCRLSASVQCIVNSGN
jgi:hypothetical protein